MHITLHRFPHIDSAQLNMCIAITQDLTLMICIILLCVFQVQVNKPQKRFESLKNTGSSMILVGDLKLMPSHHEQFMQLVTQLILNRIIEDFPFSFGRQQP